MQRAGWGWPSAWLQPMEQLWFYNGGPEDSKTGAFAAGQGSAFVAWQGNPWLLCPQQQQPLHLRQAPAAIRQFAGMTAALCELIMLCRLARESSDGGSLTYRLPMCNLTFSRACWCNCCWLYNWCLCVRLVGAFLWCRHLCMYHTC